jgi:hypothetical protein
MTNTHVRKAVVESVDAGSVTVRYGTAIHEVETLRGLNYPKVPLEIGDEGEIIYRVFPSFSLWFWKDGSKM